MPQPKRFTDEELKANKAAQARRHYEANKEKRAAYHAALHRERSADPEYMRKMAEKSAAYRAANPGVVSAQNAKRRAKDPEAARQQSREWFAANPGRRAEYEQNRRARKRANGGSITPGLKSTLFAMQKQCCACCKERFALGMLHMDHVMPLSKGGQHADANMQLLCQPCNQAKYAKHPVDFMQERGFLL